MDDIEFETAATKQDLLESQELLALAKLGARPLPAVYAAAPVLDDWRVVEARVPPAAPGMSELEGIVTGHPDFVDGQWIRTTPLLLTGTGWARTMSRYWRLGAPSRSQVQ